MLIHCLGVMAQALNSISNFHESSEAGHPQYFSMQYVAHAMSGEEGLPGVGLKLLDAERQPPLVRFDGQHYCLYTVAFLENLGRMLDTFSPAQITYVDQAVNSILNLDECAKVGQIAYSSFDGSTDRIFLHQRLPWVGL